MDADLCGGTWATAEALVARRPHDATITRYSVGADMRSLLFAREFLMRAEADRLDVVHAASTGPLAVLAMLVAARFGLPLIGSFQPPSPATSGMFSTYVRLLVRQSRRLLVMSMAARDAFLRAGIAAAKMMLWRPGVDSSLFSPSKRSEALRERWGVSEERPAVLYAGALSDTRGARRLLALELALQRTRPMHRLIVAGAGPTCDELRWRCQNAMFLGTVPRAEMPAIFASADVFVEPSDAISTNLAVLEAQASGLPVVVSEHGSAHERTSERSAAVCRSHADFVVTTATLIRTPDRRRSMGLAAREYAVTQEWGAGLTVTYAEYRAAAEISRLRRDLEPAFISQSRRL